MLCIKKCENCLNSRPIVSENGIHYLCSYSVKTAARCLMGKKDRYIPQKGGEE